MATYTSVPQSAGQVQIEGIDYVFESGTEISETAIVGERYYDPNTGKTASHSGGTEYADITLTCLVSDPQTQDLKRAFDDPSYRDGSKTAIYTMGSITVRLLKVKISSLVLPGFNKLSNDAAKITLTLSFSDTVVV